MITVYYAVCSERDGKPVVRSVYSERSRAEAALEAVRNADGGRPEDAYWMAEVGKEAETWLRFLPDNETDAAS
ncbi:MAG: hypothetical protein AAFQ82_18705 [Myxococcota bacterium]